MVVVCRKEGQGFGFEEDGGWRRGGYDGQEAQRAVKAVIGHGGTGQASARTRVGGGGEQVGREAGGKRVRVGLGGSKRLGGEEEGQLAEPAGIGVVGGGGEEERRGRARERTRENAREEARPALGQHPRFAVPARACPLSGRCGRSRHGGSVARQAAAGPHAAVWLRAFRRFRGPVPGFAACRAEGGMGAVCLLRTASPCLAGRPADARHGRRSRPSPAIRHGVSVAKMPLRPCALCA